MEFGIIGCIALVAGVHGWAGRYFRGEAAHQGRAAIELHREVVADGLAANRALAPIGGISHGSAADSGALVSARPDHADADAKMQEFLPLTAPMAAEGWTPHLLVGTAPARTQSLTVALLAASLLFASMLGAAMLWQRRRRLMERLTEREQARALLEPEDAAGLKFRVQASDMLVAQFEALGANPQKMSFKEVCGGLQTKVIDGQENTWPNLYGKKFFEVQDGVTKSSHGIIMVVNMEIGMITPPVGLNLFVTSGVAGMSMMRVVKAAMPWLGILFVFLIMITYIPWVSTVVPSYFMGPEIIVK